MRTLNLVTLLLIIIGGINWLLVGLFQFDLVAAIFGGQNAPLSRIVYILVGLSALYQIIPFFKAMSIGEPAAEGSFGHRH
jgi:uncharacterized membrane protein YuzA (DUF378 family)